MKKEYVSPNLSLMLIHSEDVMTGSEEKTLTYFESGYGDPYYYSDYFG